MDVRYISQLDDRKEISRIYEESWKWAYAGIIPQGFLDSIPEGSWADNIDRPGWRNLVCVDDTAGQDGPDKRDCLAGTCSFCKSRFEDWPEDGEIISIYLLPEYAGSGAGQKLMETALDELRRLGFDRAFLWVLEDNARARAFYDKMGFSCTEDYREDEIGGRKLREVRYAIEL